MHSLTPAQLEQLISSDAAEHLSAPARERLGWIAYFVQHGFSVSETCTHLGISRSTFHRWLERFDPEDLTSLEEKSHIPHAHRTMLVPEHIIALIRAYRQTNPLMGKERIQELLKQEHQIDISASTVGRVIERECMYYAATPLHWKKRMQVQRPVTAQPVAPQFAAPVSQTVERVVVHEEHVEKQQPQKNTELWKRMLVTISILINVAVVSVYLTTLVIESTHMKAEATTLQSHQISTVSNMDQP